MRFPFRLLCLSLVFTIPDLAAPQTLHSSCEAGDLPGLDKRHTFWKARAPPNILFILTDDQGIRSDSLIMVQSLPIRSRFAYELP
jgi:hypothetical protein